MTQQPQIYPNVSLYVGDLAPDVSEGILYEIFSTVGQLQIIKVCRDDVTKRSLGYAYVNFLDPQDAERAILSLNHTVIKGRPCRLMWQQRNPSRRRQGKGNIYIANLHESIGNKDLYDAFSQFGTISSSKVVLDDKTGNSSGYGYVHFEKEEDAQKAIELVNGKDIRGKVVYAAFFVPRNERLKARENSWTNVYFRNAPSSFGESETINLFAPFGEITSTFIKQKEFSNEIKTFGFVNFKTHEDAVAACRELNGTVIDNNEFYCARAQSKSEREQLLRKEKDLRRRDMYSLYHGRNLYVKHIDDNMSEEELRTIFSEFGSITSAKISLDENGARKGFGFICFETKESARAAVDEFSRNKTLPGYSKPLYVAFHEPKDIRRVKFATRVRRQQQNFPTGWNNYPGNPMWGPSPNQFPPQQQGMIRQQPMGGQPQGSQQPMRGQPQNVPQNQQPMMQPPTNDLPPIDVVKAMSLNEKRDVLGRILFYMIDRVRPGGYASKITGMLLEWDVQQIYDLVGNQEMMMAAVSQAVTLIDSQGQN
jgi:polyadenylate-binding protein